MTGETSGDSSRGVSEIISRVIQDSFTTQGLPLKSARRPPDFRRFSPKYRPPPGLQPGNA